MILTVTFNPAVDQTLQFDAPMDPDTVLRATDARFDAGGKGINAAQYLTAMDCPVVATGIVGGFTGQFIAETMQADGVETDFAAFAGPTRLNTSAIADGEEYKLNHDGPPVSGAVVEDVIERVVGHDPDRVLIGGSLPPGLTVSDVDAVAEAGDWDTIVDMGGEYLTHLSADYALCKPNRDELGAATGADVSTVAGCARAADQFRERGFESVLASLGPDGAILVSGDQVLHGSALDVERVDTVGAGDALLSGAIAAWEDGASDAVALRTGLAFAARVVEQAGTAVPSVEGLAAARRDVTIEQLHR